MPAPTPIPAIAPVLKSSAGGVSVDTSLDGAVGKTVVEDEVVVEEGVGVEDVVFSAVVVVVLGAAPMTMNTLDESCPVSWS